jgi:hypothetical protein
MPGGQDSRWLAPILLVLRLSLRLLSMFKVYIRLGLEKYVWSLCMGLLPSMGPETSFLTRNARCAFRTRFENQFQPVML